MSLNGAETLLSALGSTKNHASDARKVSNDSNKSRNCRLSTIFQQPVRKHEESETELFRLEVRENLSPKTLGVRPGNILIAVHDPNNLTHLEKVLDENDPSLIDVVVLSVNSDCPNAASEDPMHPDEVINLCETKVFSKVVYIAERLGKPVHLLAVPGESAYELILLAANRLRSSRVMISLSERGSAETQEREIVVAWERLARPRPELRVEIVPDGEEASWKVDLGRHLVLPSGVDRDIGIPDLVGPVSQARALLCAARVRCFWDCHSPSRR